jgi:hypothetical protein
MPGGRPLKFQDSNEIETKINEYFEYRREKEMPFTITGLALWLDCEVETLKSYQERDEFSASIKKAYLMCQEYAERQLYTSKNPAGPIFGLKNFGWSDTQKIDVNSTVSYQLPADIKRLTE